MRILLTGGGGTLGTELQPRLREAGHEVLAPPRAELDVTDASAAHAAVTAAAPELVVHAAAWTDVAGAERAREACWRVNVEGTRFMASAAAAAGARFVQVSTDYVFWGDRGGYREDDPPGPVRNYYALTKLVAEEAARAHGDALILRTSFRPRAWPHPVAFEDLFTSQDYVDRLAPDLAHAIAHAPVLPFDVLHVAGERRSVLDLARERAPDVRAGRRADAPVALPEDISLDSSRWRSWARGGRS